MASDDCEGPCCGACSSFNTTGTSVDRVSVPLLGMYPHTDEIRLSIDKFFLSVECSVCFRQFSA